MPSCHLDGMNDIYIGMLVSAKLDSLNSIPGTHMVEERRESCEFSSDLQMHIHRKCVPLPQTHKNKQPSFIFALLDVRCLDFFLIDSMG